MAKMTKKEILECIYSETTYLNCLQKDYSERYTQMTSIEHLNRQTSISQSHRRLAHLNEALAEFYAESKEVGEMVEMLIFEINKKYQV